MLRTFLNIYYTRNTTPFGVVFLRKNVILFF